MGQKIVWIRKYLTFRVSTGIPLIVYRYKRYKSPVYVYSRLVFKGKPVYFNDIPGHFNGIPGHFNGIPGHFNCIPGN